MDYLSFQTILKAIGIVLSDEQISAFKRYFLLLQEWNEKMNLTAIKLEEEMIEKHFYDSLLMAKVIELNGQTLLDVGSGAGFPGIPLKIAFPQLNITLLEPTNKRANFLRLVIDELHLSKIEVIAERAENLVIKKREKYDIVTARAVASLNILAELCLPLVKVHGHFIAMKGAKALEELKEAEKALKILNGVVKHIDAQVLTTAEDKRFNILVEKTGKTDPKYPRSYAQIKHRPL